MELIRGETVTVLAPAWTRDELGERVPGEPVRTEVAGVVVAPGATSDLDATRPEGIEVSYTLCFPKGFRADLRDCEVEVRGERYRVVGDPKRWTAANTPGTRDLTAEVVRTDG